MVLRRRKLVQESPRSRSWTPVTTGRPTRSEETITSPSATAANDILTSHRDLLRRAERDGLRRVWKPDSENVSV